MAKFAFRVGFGFISLGHVNRFFLSFFLFKAGASALKLFFAGDGYAIFQISPMHLHCQHFTQRRRSLLFEHNELGMKSLTALHAASIVSSVATDFLHSTVQCFFQTHRACGLPTHTKFGFSGHFWVTFGSVATCSGRSTRNVNMPPHPTPLLHAYSEATLPDICAA